MNFGTAVSIGLEAIKNGQSLGTALGGALSASKLAGNEFGKIATRLGLNENLGQQVGQVLDKVIQPKSLTGTQVMNGLQYFDADKNGQISKAELSQGLQKLQDLGVSQSGESQKLHQLGEQLLKNYDRVARQDGLTSGISYRDVGQVMAQDGNKAGLSQADWQKLNV